MIVSRVDKLACDFCGKTQDEVASLIAGPKSVCICDECVVVAADIVKQQREAKAAKEPA